MKNKTHRLAVEEGCCIVDKTLLVTEKSIKVACMDIKHLPLIHVHVAAVLYCVKYQ